MRRTRKFLRPLAMGDAFTAVADSKETIAYNPAGLIIKDAEWSLSFKLLGMTMKSGMDENDLSDDSSMFPSVGQSGDCNVGIGNVGASDKVDRDVIILGDVINVCE